MISNLNYNARTKTLPQFSIFILKVNDVKVIEKITVEHVAPNYCIVTVSNQYFDSRPTKKNCSWYLIFVFLKNVVERS